MCTMSDGLHSSGKPGTTKCSHINLSVSSTLQICLWVKNCLTRTLEGFRCMRRKRSVRKAPSSQSPATTKLWYGNRLSLRLTQNRIPRGVRLWCANLRRDSKITPPNWKLSVMQTQTHFLEGSNLYSYHSTWIFDVCVFWKAFTCIDTSIASTSRHHYKPFRMRCFVCQSCADSLYNPCKTTPLYIRHSSGNWGHCILKQAAEQVETLKEQRRSLETENRAEILHTLMSDMMTERPEAAHLGLGGKAPCQVPVDRWKGMSTGQLSTIHKERMEQQRQTQVLDWIYIPLNIQTHVRLQLLKSFNFGLH